MNLRQLAYGVVSRIPFVPSSVYGNKVDVWPAEYCYSVWMRHLVLACRSGMQFPRAVAELGPGGSVGVGLAALISGANRYLAFDAVKHVRGDNDAELFDALVEMFKRRASVPGQAEFPDMIMALEPGAFPSDVLSDEHLAEALDPDRLAKIRRTLLQNGYNSRFIRYVAPWDGESAGERVDFILSSAVMEHVVELEKVYHEINRWLSPGGYASHQIDFRSHGLFSRWDGHWFCPDWLWSLMVGTRLYLLNRAPLSKHLEAVSEAGFQLVRVDVANRRPSTGRRAARFATMTESDRSAASAYILCLKS